MMKGSNPHLSALEGIVLDAKKARVLGPSRASEGEGPAEILRALGKQLLDAAKSLETGEGAVAVEVSAAEPADFEEYENSTDEDEDEGAEDDLEKEDTRQQLRKLLNLS